MSSWLSLREIIQLRINIASFRIFITWLLSFNTYFFSLQVQVSYFAAFRIRKVRLIVSRKRYLSFFTTLWKSFIIIYHTIYIHHILQKSTVLSFRLSFSNIVKNSFPNEREFINMREVLQARDWFFAYRVPNYNATIVTGKSTRTRVNASVYLPCAHRVPIFTPSTDKLHKTRAPTRKFIAGLRAVVCRRGNWYRSLISADVVSGKRRRRARYGIAAHIGWEERKRRKLTRGARERRWWITVRGLRERGWGMVRMAKVDKRGWWPQRGGRKRKRRGRRGNCGGWCTRGGWTRSLWQPWLGFRAPRQWDGLGNVSTRLGMDFSRFATKWG